MSADVHDLAARRLAAAGQRYTPSRRALVDRLHAADAPITVTDIADGRALATSTVYRNLRVLEDAGVVARIVTSGDFACFELAEELGSHHHHLICRNCHAVADFDVPHDLEGALHDLPDLVRTGTGFHADRHRLDLLGTCAACS